jgi:hypothetical protein
MECYLKNPTLQATWRQRSLPLRILGAGTLRCWTFRHASRESSGSVASTEIPETSAFIACKFFKFYGFERVSWPTICAGLWQWYVSLAWRALCGTWALQPFLNGWRATSLWFVAWYSQKHTFQNALISHKQANGQTNNKEANTRAHEHIYINTNTNTKHKFWAHKHKQFGGGLPQSYYNLRKQLCLFSI